MTVFRVLMVALLTVTLGQISCGPKKSPQKANGQNSPEEASGQGQAVDLATKPKPPHNYGLDDLSWDLKYEGPRQYPRSERVSPCEDLYAHACEVAEKNFTLPPDQPYFPFAMGDASLKARDSRVKFLVETIKSEDLDADRLMLKNYFIGCQDSEAYSRDLSQKLEGLKKLIDGFSDKQQILDYAADNISDLGFSFLTAAPISNLSKPAIQDVYFGTKHLVPLGLKEHYEDATMMADYSNLLSKMFEVLGYESPKQRAQQVVEFEKRVMAKFPAPSEMRALYSADSYVDKEAYVQMLPALKIDKFFAKVASEAKVRQLYGPSVIEVNSLVAESSTEALQNILRRFTLSDLASLENKEFAEMAKSFAEKHLNKPKKSEKPDPAKVCLKETMDKFDRNIDFAIIDTFAAGFDQEKFDNMVRKIKETLVQRISANSWLSDESKKGALLKLEKMSFQTVRPKTKEDWDLIPVMNFQPDHPLANEEMLSRAQIQHTLATIGKEANQNVWAMSPLEVNAYYKPTANQFVIPMGILQPPLYDSNVEEEINLGAIGMIIGHEIGHGVDDSGAKYDEEGRVRQWMTNEDKEKFVANGAALKKYYEAEGHNGDLTLGENIADLSGLNIAFDAAFPEGKGSLEQKQEFFLQFARSWCGVMRPGYKEEKLKTDPHSVTPTRVNVPVKHIEGFYEAFSCKPQDKMYLAPEERVKIW